MKIVIRISKILVFMLALMIVFSNCAFALSESEVAELKAGAEKGEPEAQNDLGLLYLYGGDGIEQNKLEAEKLFLQAAEKGNAEAQYNLALMYDEGDGVKQDKAESVKWYLKSAEQGLPESQYNLGIMYENGEGVTQNHEEAVKLFQEAVRQGFKNAQDILKELNETW